MKANLKICAISDIHGAILPIEDYFEPCDIVVICGDISPLDIQANNKKMKKWLLEVFKLWAEYLPCDKVYFVAGNHDWIAYRDPDFMYNNFTKKDKVTYLCDDLDIYKSKDGKEYTIYGTPWCPDLSRWAFYGDHETLVQKFSEIPEKVNILLTHCPPRIEDYGTVLQDFMFNTFNNYGCIELAEAIQKKHPVINVFGHVHSGDHTDKEISGTRLCNVSLKDEQYNLTYSPKYLNI